MRGTNCTAIPSCRARGRGCSAVPARTDISWRCRLPRNWSVRCRKRCRRRCASGRNDLKRDDFSAKCHPALSYLFEHDLLGKPVPTFPDHALALRGFAGGAACRLGGFGMPPVVITFARTRGAIQPLLCGGLAHILVPDVDDGLVADK